MRKLHWFVSSSIFSAQLPLYWYILSTFSNLHFLGVVHLTHILISCCYQISGQNLDLNSYVNFHAPRKQLFYNPVRWICKARIFCVQLLDHVKVDDHGSGLDPNKEIDQKNDHLCRYQSAATAEAVSIRLLLLLLNQKWTIIISRNLRDQNNISEKVNWQLAPLGTIIHGTHCV